MVVDHTGAAVGAARFVRFPARLALALLLAAAACSSGPKRPPTGTPEPDKFLFERGTAAAKDEKYISIAPPATSTIAGAPPRYDTGTTSIPPAAIRRRSIASTGMVAAPGVVELVGVRRCSVDERRIAGREVVLRAPHSGRALAIAGEQRHTPDRDPSPRRREAKPMERCSQQRKHLGIRRCVENPRNAPLNHARATSARCHRRRTADTENDRR